MRGAIAIFKRDFKKFTGNPIIIVMTLFMPIMYLIIFGNAMGGTITHIPIGVAQEDPHGNTTSLYLSAVDGLTHFHTEDNPRMFDVTVFSGEATAKQAFAAGKVMAVAIFPSEVSNDHAVRLYVDGSEYLIPGLIQSGVSGMMVQAGAENPLQVSKIYGDIKYIQFFGVGVIVMAIFMTTMMGGGIGLIRDRENGIIEGYLVTPVKRSSIIFGIIASGTVKAFMAGFVIFLVDIFVAGVLVDSMETFMMVLVVLFIISIGITSFVVSFSSTVLRPAGVYLDRGVLKPPPLHDQRSVLPGARHARLAPLDRHDQSRVLCNSRAPQPDPAGTGEPHRPRPSGAHHLLRDRHHPRDHDLPPDAGVRGGNLPPRLR